MSPLVAAAWQSMGHAAAGLHEEQGKGGRDQAGLACDFLLGVCSVNCGRAGRALDGVAERVVGRRGDSFLVKPRQKEFGSSRAFSGVGVVEERKCAAIVGGLGL